MITLIQIDKFETVNNYRVVHLNLTLEFHMLFDRTLSIFTGRSAEAGLDLTL